MKSYEAFYYRTLYATFSLGSRLKKGVKIVALGDASLIRREVFETVGGFDEKFSPVGGQDVEFGIRVRKYGFKTKYSRIAKYYHSTTVQTRLRNKMKKAILYNHGMVKAYLKHRDYVGSNLAGCWFLVMLYPLLSVLRRLLV
jgi:GT2 family glycosyltransferase